MGEPRLTNADLISQPPQPDLARSLGWEEVGVKKGSFAARIMSKETKACGGRLRSMCFGGVSASLQSIGSTGLIKDEAHDSLEAFRKRGLDVAKQLRILGQLPRSIAPAVNLPVYFSHAANTGMQLVPYRTGGYNVARAEKMLNESIHPTCGSGSGCNQHGGCRTFQVVHMERLENTSLYCNFKLYEATTAIRNNLFRPNTSPSTHAWLTALARKNGLSLAANTHYLLHGTNLANLGSICEHGLLVARAKSTGLYGQGLYFTESSCKAQSYGDGVAGAGHGCILVCRVVIGSVYVAQRDCAGTTHAPPPYDSVMARSSTTTRPDGTFSQQLHNEFIVFDNCAVYPEFALQFSYGPANLRVAT
jgi:hypothetical protein